MTIQADIKITKHIDIKVPHNLYELFLYEEWETGCRLPVHYGMYHLQQLVEEMFELDYDLEQEELDFIEEVYNYCEQAFLDTEFDVEVEFLDEEF